MLVPGRGDQEQMQTDNAITLADAGLEAVFVPRLGLVGVSLRSRGEELLGRVGELTAYVEQGSVLGIPLLHPWANRLEGFRYRREGRSVELEPGSPLLPLDENGLPIHGVSGAKLAWNVREQGPARLVAVLEWDKADLLAIFPFPHRLETTLELGSGSLEIATVLSATGDAAVPVAFGYHPYLTLPGAGRASWRLQLPPMERLDLDERMIPSGRTTRFEGYDAAIDDLDLDAGFVGIGEPAEFVVAGGGRRITVTFLEGYPYAQVFVPPGKDYVAIEPMTAPANALVSGDGLRVVAPGETFRARFRIHVGA